MSRYEMPFRPNYELLAAAGWVGAAVAASWVNQATPLPAEPFYWMGGICSVMALARLPLAIRLHYLKRRLLGRAVEHVSLARLARTLRRDPGTLWLGYGFAWENRHAQRVYEILKRDLSRVVAPAASQGARGDSPLEMGHYWIHGLEPRERALAQPLAHSEGHTLIVGTTGSGKTRLFDLLIAQAILRGEAVLILDPKGDRELQDNARRACEFVGRAEAFYSFHPAFPERSARLNPLRNFSRVTEIASRIAALVPSETGSDPFKSFGWQALNNVCQGLYLLEQRPTLKSLRRYLEGGTENLVVRTVGAHCQRTLGEGWERQAQAFSAKLAGPLSPAMRAKLLTLFYRQTVQPAHPCTELEGLLSMFEHDHTHFAKMVATLLPVLNMLTSGDLGPLLSPDTEDDQDLRPITDSARLISEGAVAYIGLDSLTDNMVASAIGSIILSDLTAVAGDRYNYGVDNRPVNVFVDEAAEVINEPFIMLLNKGRGARLKLFVATQTYADFAARLGSEHKALQVLGNINNTLALRVKDAQTQEFLIKDVYETRIQYVQRSQNMSGSDDQPLVHGGGQGERLMEEQVPLVDHQLLGMLPNFEFFAKISGGQVFKGRVPVLGG